MSVPITVYFFSIASPDIKTSMLRFTEVYFVAKQIGDLLPGWPVDVYHERLANLPSDTTTLFGQH